MGFEAPMQQVFPGEVGENLPEFSWAAVQNLSLHTKKPEQKAAPVGSKYSKV